MPEPRSLTLEEAFDEVMRLRRLEALVRAWAVAHRAAWPTTTIDGASRGPVDHASRADLRAAEIALRDEVLRMGGAG